MDDENCRLAAGLVSGSYINQGQQALVRRRKLIKALLSSRKMPELGWDDATIEMFVQDCALMDSNNFIDNVGVGEREARVACQLVARRHCGLAHGIGRSGDVAAEQPKAAGSSLLAKVTNLLAADAMKVAGFGDLGPVTVLPLATGMALTITLLALLPSRPAGARSVLWPRIDQKTCLKAITAAGLTPVVLEMQLVGDELRTDTQAMRDAVNRLGPDSIACIVTTTSCFAPRGADSIVEVAKLCAATGIPHIINNAYGIQSDMLCKLITSAWRKGRVDAVVQSTDKNFMVPVGGAVVAAPANRGALVDAVNKTYPGRASMGAHLDLLMTLLHWGSAGWRQVLGHRELVYPMLRAALEKVAEFHGERVLSTPGNPISVAMTLDRCAEVAAAAGSSITFLGAMLWSRCVSGTRVVAPGKVQQLCGCTFVNYGSHHDNYPSVYLTAAAAVGTTSTEVDEFVQRLSKCLTEFKRKVVESSARKKQVLSQQGLSDERTEQQPAAMVQAGQIAHTQTDVETAADSG
ncbi:MAG: hypothetical protein WDW38_005614 [Sanguina aurantia]